MIHSDTITRSDGSNVQLLQVRNPWGSEQYTGKWSDSWLGWTDYDITAVNNKFAGQGGTGHEVSSNGLFFIDFDSYMDNFYRTSINQDTSNWNLKYFLMHDDPNDLENKATAECTGCVKHQIIITNNGSAQDMWVGSHVWQKSGYGPGCAGYGTGSDYSVWEEGVGNYSQNRFSSYSGSIWIPDTIRFTKGETKIINAVFDWNNSYAK